MALVNRITASPASLSSRTASLIDPTADCTHPRQPAVGLPPPSLHPDVHGRVAPFVGALTPLPLPCLAVPPALVPPARLPACPVPAAPVPAGALAPVQPPLVTNYHAAPPVAPPLRMRCHPARTSARAPPPLLCVRVRSFWLGAGRPAASQLRGASSFHPCSSAWCALRAVLPATPAPRPGTPSPLPHMVPLWSARRGIAGPAVSGAKPL